MKTFDIVLRVLAVLAAIAAAVFVIVTYGDRIAAWAKRMLGKINSSCCREAAEIPTEQAPAQEETVQAEEADFEG